MIAVDIRVALCLVVVACAEQATRPTVDAASDAPKSVGAVARTVDPPDVAALPPSLRRPVGWIDAPSVERRPTEWPPWALIGPQTPTDVPHAAEPTAAEAGLEPPNEAPSFDAAVAQLKFTDVTSAAGVDKYDAGHSAAWGDLDGDGWPDLAVPAAFENVVVIYKNLHDGTFSAFNTLPIGGNPLAVAIADYNGDGKPDLAACGGSSIVLFKANGGGYLWSVQDWDTTAICSMIGFVDLNGDGLLDLFTAMSKGVESMPASVVDWCNSPCTIATPSPPDLTGKNRVFLQQPGGTFKDVTDSSPLADPWRTLAFSTGHWLAGDASALFVGNDTNANHLFALPVGPDATDLLCSAGTTDCLATMGVVPADIDGDGHLDIVATDIESQHLYLNHGDGTFENASDAFGITAATLGDVGWGAVAADFDNDGDLDLAFGDKQTDVAGSVKPQRPAFLLHHGKTFTRLGTEQGFPWLADVEETYGVQTADFDRDGDLDVLWVEKFGRLWLFRNDSVTPGHWLRIRLHGTPPNTAAIGAFVRVTTGWTDRVQEGPGVSGAAGQNEPTVHFGLGSATLVDKVVVTFASGKVRSVGPVAVDQEIDVSEP